MARWSERPRFEVGDEVSNGTESGVIRLTFANKAGKRYPIVRIASGSRCGQEEWPNAPWKALLDYEPRTSRFRCTACDREYWAPESKGWCRQCVQKDEAATDRRTRTESGSLVQVGRSKKYSGGSTGANNPAPAPPAKKREEDPTIPF